METSFDLSEHHGSVDILHRNLMSSFGFLFVNEKVWSLVFRGMRLADNIHYMDRRSSGELYIHHPIRLVVEYIKKYKKISSETIIVLILHDAIEDHPETWKDILELVGPKIFRDILVLSKIPLFYRREMLEYFGIKGYEITPFTEIAQILSPADPWYKLDNRSKYAQNNIDEISKVKIGNAISFYKQYIIIPSKDTNEKKEDEYISLGNYLYFTQEDARRKMRDMLDNMHDMKNMEEIKPGYTEKRRIKAYILSVVLQSYGMQDEIADLQEAFQIADTTMLTDAYVANYSSREDPIES